MPKKLLLVEDSPTQQKVIRSMLVKDGYEVVCAKNGLEGLNLAVQERPNVIITDALMPEMDGFEMCRQLKRNTATKTIPLIMLTVLSSIRDLVNCLECGVDNFIIKPFKHRELTGAIEQLVAYRELEMDSEPYALDLFDKVLMINHNQQQILGKILKKMERMEKIALESMDIIVVTDGDGLISDMNFGAESLLQINKNDAVGIKTVEQFFTEPTEPMELVSRLKDKDQVKDIETSMKNLFGEPLDVTLNLTYLKTGDGKIDGYIFVAKDITEKKKDEKELLEKTRELEKLSYTDSLTGLGNRRAFDDTIKSEIARSKRHGHPLSLLILDIDDFKKFNDAYGHPEGDKVLISIASCIKNSLRQKVDYGCRHGGEEFAAILPNTHGKGSRVAADRILRDFKNTAHSVREIKPGGTAEEKNIFCTVSIGITEYHPGLTADEFIRAADIALYNAKRAGKNCLRYYERMDERKKPYHVLTVTEDPSIAKTISKHLNAIDHLTVSVANSYDAALAKATEYIPDLVVIDQDSTFINTDDLFRSLKELRPTRRMPAIMLGKSPKKKVESSEPDVGVTDFLQKPIDGELLAQKISEMLLPILDPSVLKK